MIIQHTQLNTHKDSVVMAYATPQLSRLGSIRDVTAVTGNQGDPGGNKGGNAREGNPGQGGGDLRRPA